jgi:predicted DCC family thiol-disulfide oxidoreductase YuxK
VQTTQVLIYDGDCAFCKLSLDFGIRHLDWFPSYVAFQKIDPAKFGLLESQVRTSIWLIPDAVNPESSKSLSGHLAAAEILVQQKNLFWKLLGRSIKSRLLSPIAAWVYAFVAKNRHRMPGGTKQCKIEDTYFD